MKTAIEMTNAIFPKLNKIAILGDMLELGDIEKDEHQKIGELLCSEKFNQAYIYGANCNSYLRGIKQKISVNLLSNHSEISNFLDLKKIDNTVILIKGSRGSQMEKILEFLEI
jgi:UDP-N-acetylmuramoyl-tripeptide--D-alanyl-D-alanine ligase